MTSKKNSSLYVADGNGQGPYGLIGVHPVQRNFIIEGPQEGKVANRLRLNS